MAKHKVEIQDHLGNIYYPHTTTDVVFDGSGKRLSSLLDNKLDKQEITAALPLLNNLQGKITLVQHYQTIQTFITDVHKQNFARFSDYATTLSQIPTGFIQQNNFATGSHLAGWYSREGIYIEPAHVLHEGSVLKVIRPYQENSVMLRATYLYRK